MTREMKLRELEELIPDLRETKRRSTDPALSQEQREHYKQKAAEFEAQRNRLREELTPQVKPSLSR